MCCSNVGAAVVHQSHNMLEIIIMGLVHYKLIHHLFKKVSIYQKFTFCRSSLSLDLVSNIECGIIGILVYNKNGITRASHNLGFILFSFFVSVL